MHRKLSTGLIISYILLSVSAVSAAGTDSTSVWQPDSAATVAGDAVALHEVVITATESKGLTSTSRIGRDAMAHLQPSSFADLLELLPGNISHDPDMSSFNGIRLRETGSVSATGSATDNPDYAISSLGTSFIVDGTPINTDAGLQSIGTGTDASSPGYKRNSTNRGVDMRNIATDNIESVEIVRGIPSAEYGNLTSGLVNIRRIKSATPLRARFKADGNSKLFSIGKGLRLGTDNTLNIDAGWLDFKEDPRNSLENYNRINASARAEFNFTTGQAILQWNTGTDFTASTDNSKTDPDLSLIKTDIYKSTYRRYSLNNSLRLSLPYFKWINSIELTASASAQDDRIERQKQTAPTRAVVVPSSMEEGVHDGRFLFGEYIADYLCEGRPVSVFLKLRATGRAAHGSFSHRYKAGLQWDFSKNYGRGQVYDLEKPLTASWTTRPRDYRSIPSLQILSAFAEDEVTFRTGRHKAILEAGLRLTTLPALDSRYDLSGKVYPDPRINLSWTFPGIATGHASKPLEFSVAAGYGLTSRMPTVDYLFPQASYKDIVQLSYYDTSHPQELSRVNLRTYIDDATNYSLRAARNNKYEFRIGARLGANSLSVTYFEERMRSGFRYSNSYGVYDYRRYDASAINSAELTAPPALDNLPYEDLSVLRSYRRVENGSRIDKHGVEFQLTTVRWRPVATALTISGAWFRSRYSNSQMLYSAVNDVVGNEAVSDRYVGLYDTDDGSVNDQFNTNFIFDTQIPRLGLIISTSIQCSWWLKTRRLWQNGVPAYYLDATDGMLHEYTDAAASDPVLQFLTKRYNDSQYDTRTIPTALYLNLKATKTIGRHFQVAVYVNRLFDYLPDYTSNGLTIRRSADAYFGMELNITI